MKAFALLNLKTLRTYQFNNRGDMAIAYQDLKDSGVELIILKWNAQSETYTLPEVCE